MNPDLGRLQAYPFERLQRLLADITPPPETTAVALTLGEPRHRPPDAIVRTLVSAVSALDRYPLTAGLLELRQSCARWLQRRFRLTEHSIDAESMVLPVSGTREALFAFAQVIVDRRCDAAVLMPNPFYQIYEGAALLAGADAVYMNALEQNDYVPQLDDVSESDWQRCQLIYVCSPGNPTGAVLPVGYLAELIERAHRYDFVIAADECYADIYRDEDNPPPGLLQVSEQLGNKDHRRCVVFHSLSKRCSVPGLRSGFVAGDADLLERFRLYRSYHGCAMPVHHQLASIVAWDDDDYPRDNRALYTEKFASAGRLIAQHLDVRIPDAAFYLWATTPVDDELFAQRLYSQHNISVLPGRYLARDTAAGNPGSNRIRLSLVASVEDCQLAAERIAEFCSNI